MYRSLNTDRFSRQTAINVRHSDEGWGDANSWIDLKARVRERVQPGPQINFRWMAFITASRRLWVRNFWLMW
jgi:hypothetical protein